MFLILPFASDRLGCSRRRRATRTNQSKALSQRDFLRLRRSVNARAHIFASPAVLEKDDQRAAARTMLGTR
jgi:hypothetical protein